VIKTQSIGLYLEPVSGFATNTDNINFLSLN
jgi:hypothetical protein